VRLSINGGPKKRNYIVEECYLNLKQKTYVQCMCFTSGTFFSPFVISTFFIFASPCPLSHLIHFGWCVCKISDPYANHGHTQHKTCGFIGGIEICVRRCIFFEWTRFSAYYFSFVCTFSGIFNNNFLYTPACVCAES